MSIEIASQLRNLSRQAALLAERHADAESQRKLAAIVAELTRIAEKLERDARD